MFSRPNFTFCYLETEFGFCRSLSFKVGDLFDGKKLSGL